MNWTTVAGELLKLSAKRLTDGAKHAEQGNVATAHDHMISGMITGDIAVALAAGLGVDTSDMKPTDGKPTEQQQDG